MEKELEQKARKRLEKAGKKLDAAMLLLRDGFFDDSVSRAYYSMFHAAKALLTLKRLDPKKHKSVISLFGLHFVNKGVVDRYLGRALGYAKEMRETGDYEEFAETDEATAKMVIEDAEAFLKKVKTVLNEMLEKGA